MRQARRQGTEPSLTAWLVQCHLPTSTTDTLHHISSQCLQTPDLYHKHRCPYLTHRNRRLLLICRCEQCNTNINLNLISSLPTCKITTAMLHRRKCPCIINQCPALGQQGICKVTLLECPGRRGWGPLVLLSHMPTCTIRRGLPRCTHCQTT